MIYFSKQVKFKKQSESLGLNLNDKHIKKSKNNLMQLVQKHQQIDTNLKQTKIEFVNQKKRIIEQHRYLTEEEKRHKIKLIKLQVRRDQLAAKENQQIYHIKANILKKYLKSMTYTIGDKFQIIQYLKNCSSYQKQKTRVIHLEFKIYLKQKFKEIVYLKKVKFQDQMIMVCIKQKLSFVDDKRKSTQSQISSFKTKTSKSLINPSGFMPLRDNIIHNKMYEISIYALTGKFFQIKKQYSENQLKKYLNQLPNRPIKSNRKSNILQNLNKKHRLSLQFNPFFKKGLQEFFTKGRNSFQTQNKMDSNGTENQNVRLSFKENQNQQNYHKQSHDISHIQESEERTKRSQVQQIKKQRIKQQDINQNENNQQSLQSIQSSSRIDPQENNQSSNQPLTPTTTKNSSDCNQTGYSGVRKSFLDGNELYLLPIKNPILNLVILKRKNSLQILPQYLNIKKNAAKIDLSFRKYKLKLELQRRVKKILMYKTMKINNFFQTINNVIQPVQLQFLFLVKYAKDDIYIPKKEQIDSSEKLANLQKKSFKKIKQKTNDIFFLNNSQKSGYKLFNNDDIVITCQNIKSYPQKFTLLIHQILKMQERFQPGFNNISNLNLLNNNRNKFRVKQNNKKKIKQKDSFAKQKSTIKDANKIKQEQAKLIQAQKLKEEKLREDVLKLFNKFMNEHIIEIEEQKFIVKIDFNQHINKIIKIQNYLKMKYYRDIYKKTQRPKICFKHDRSTHILVSVVQDAEKGNIRAYVECTNLMLKYSHKQKPLQYQSKYWNTIQTSIKNINKISQSVVQAKDELFAFLKKKITTYDQQQQKIESLKPEMYLNRLRRFFINIMLRSKAKRNIWHIKKVSTSFGTCVLIVRNSQLLSNVFDVNLYYLEQLQQKEKEIQQQMSQDQQRRSLSSESFSQKSLYAQNKKNKRLQKIRYQTISIRKEYLLTLEKSKIHEEFFFDINNFLLKPLKSPQIKFIQRLNCISINCEQISKEMTFIQIQNPLKKKRGLNLFKISSTQSFKQFGFDSMSNSDSIKLLEESSLSKLKHRSSIKKQSKILGRSSKVSSICNQSSNKLSEQRISKNSIMGIFNRQKIQYKLLNNAHQQIIYYSLLKSEDVFYYLDLYIVHRTLTKQNKNSNKSDLQRKNLNTNLQNSMTQIKMKQNCYFNDELVLIGRQPLSKKELLEANWSLVYQKIAQWLKDHQYLLEKINPLEQVEDS